ncbi:MAG TPA: HAMP domain-containing sensor histidine kinase, partial [Aggregicoccus sp.]|nr:HAMP domain-containing sensor histidine kinase [Aggregicoccus sp.]
LGPQAAFVVSPLRIGARLHGTLTFICDGATYGFGDEELTLLEEVAAHAALALDHARLFREAQSLLRLREQRTAPLHLTLQERLHALQRQLEELARTELAAQGVPGALEQMGRQVHQAALLLDRLLELSQACARQLQRELTPVDLREVVGERISRSQHMAEAQGEHLEVEAPEPVPGHWARAQLEEVVGSLLSHALQHGCGNPVHVQVSAHAGQAHLVVRDEGIGIAPEDAQRLCGTLDTSPAPGALAHARQLVSQLGGSLAVHSAPGRGSTFLVTLPQHPAA